VRPGSRYRSSSVSASTTGEPPSTTSVPLPAMSVAMVTLPGRRTKCETRQQISLELGERQHKRRAAEHDVRPSPGHVCQVDEGYVNLIGQVDKPPFVYGVDTGLYLWRWSLCRAAPPAR
jgi:hypothetical protein